MKYRLISFVYGTKKIYAEVESLTMARMIARLIYKETTHNIWVVDLEKNNRIVGRYSYNGFKVF